jgi:hypothetical protein
MWRHVQGERDPVQAGHSEPGELSGTSQTNIRQGELIIIFCQVDFFFLLFISYKCTFIIFTFFTFHCKLSF